MKNYKASATQRTRQSANREFRMAAKANKIEPFGLRRRLAFESQQPILETFKTLIDDGVIDDRVRPRTSLHVTEMPKINISKQLRQGIVVGYELGRKSVKARQEITDAFSNQLVVSLGKAAIFKQGNIGYRVHNEELEEEYHDVRVAMGRIGIKGTMRDVEPLHITCGNVPREMRRREIFSTIDIMNEMLEVNRSTDDLGEQATVMPKAASLTGFDRQLLYIPETVILDPIEFYPDEY